MLYYFEYIFLSSSVVLTFSYCKSCNIFAHILYSSPDIGKMSSSDEFASADEDLDVPVKKVDKCVPNKEPVKSPTDESCLATKGLRQQVRKLDRPKRDGAAKLSRLGQSTAEKGKRSPQTDVTHPQVTQCWEFESWEDYKAEEEAESANKVEKSTEKDEQLGKGKHSPRGHVTPPQVTQCWEFESWEDYKKEEEAKSVKKKEQVAAKVEDDQDGWDIDDWDEPTGSDLENKTSAQNLYGVFPKSEILTTNNEDVSKVLDKLSMGTSEPSRSTTTSWWGGLSSFVSTATESVATLTSHVSHGLSTVIETGMGVPDPVELARQDRQQESNIRKLEQSQSAATPTEATNTKAGPSSLGNFVSGVTQISNKVITGGLDTLEGIGKKTMTMLQENDPGLLNKRKLLGLDGGDRPVLSQILREAKEKTEETEKNMKQLQKHMYKKQLHFETLFDDYCGLVHLEALEMLSKQSTFKLESLMAPLSGKALREMQETIAEVAELCELPDSGDAEDSDGTHSADDLNARLETAFEDMDVKVDFKELIDVWNKDNTFLTTDQPRSAQELHDKALHSLAQTTAIAVNKMHKLAELLLVEEHHNTVNEADSLVQLTTTLCWHLSGIAARFGAILSDASQFVRTDNEDVSALITSIFLEGSNSTSYIQNAFHLFIPILQMGAA